MEKKDFPEKLKRLRNAPKKLYMIGNFNLLFEEAFGVVGTRKITEYGKKNCENFSKELVFRNIPIVSGMALGTDTVAHESAICFGGKTIAVLGSGFGNIFPKENKDLFEKIIEKNGLVVTEFEYDTKPLKENFPKRNRIITALSEGILVIEAGYRSGSSITANNAIKQGKLVFALPGLLDSNVGVGVNNLIKKGAILTTSIQDILNNYPQFAERKRTVTKKITAKREKIKKEYQELYGILENGEGTIDEIIEKLQMETRSVLKLLTQMQIDEIVMQDAMGKYILI